MTEKFKGMTIKEVFTNEACLEILNKMAPQLTKFPMAMVGHKKCGEIFQLAVSMKLVDVATRDALVDALQKALGIE